MIAKTHHPLPLSPVPFTSYTFYMRVLILGLGSSGGGAEAAEYYLKLGNEVLIMESSGKNLPENLKRMGAVIVSKSEALEAAKDADLVVKLPGIPIPYAIKTRAKRTTNDIAALLENPRTENIQKILIAGDKGKTSTASALSSALSQLGMKAAFSEGIGYSAFHILSELENDNMMYDVLILELSHWQIRDTAESLNYKWPRIDIIGVTDELKMPSSPSDFNAEGALLFGPWARKVIIPRTLKDRLVFAGLVPKTKVRTFPSIFNPYRYRSGMELAWECVCAMGFRKRDALRAFLSYRGIPNRLELVCVHDGISFINDSASVLPLSVAFSMRGMRGTPVNLILGGTDHGSTDPSMFMDAIEDAVSVTLLSGSLTDKLITLLRREGIRYNGPFDRMEDAVNAAIGTIIERRGVKNTSEIVLLSPGAYADEHFTNEFERGREFRTIADRIKDPSSSRKDV